MVWNYKQIIKKWSAEILRKCLAEIKAGKISIFKAPTNYGVPYGQSTMNEDFFKKLC